MILNHDFVKYIFTETMTILYFLLKLFINEVKKNSTLSQIFKPEKIHYIYTNKYIICSKWPLLLL